MLNLTKHIRPKILMLLNYFAVIAILLVAFGIMDGKTNLMILGIPIFVGFINVIIFLRVHINRHKERIIMPAIECINKNLRIVHIGTDHLEIYSKIERESDNQVRFGYITSHGRFIDVEAAFQLIGEKLDESKTISIKDIYPNWKENA